jgi:archaellum component FlaC
MRSLSRNNLTNLKVRLSILIILATVIPLIVFSIFSYEQVESVFIKQKLGDMMNIIDSKYIHLLDVLSKDKADIASQTHLLEEPLKEFYASGDRAKLIAIKQKLQEIRRLNKISQKHPFKRPVLFKNRFDELMIIGKDGRVLVSTRSSSVGQNLSQSSLFTKGRKSIFIKDVYRDYTGKVVFDLVAPIIEGKSPELVSGNQPKSRNGETLKGNLLGVLVAKVPAGYLSMLITGELGNVTGGKLWFAGYGKSTEFYIMNKHGYKITGSGMPKGYNTSLRNYIPPLKVKGSKLPLKLGLNTKVTGDRTSNVGILTGGREAMDIYKNQKGKLVAGASMVVFDIPWILVIEENTEDAFAPIIKLKYTYIYTVIFIIILAGAVGIYITRGLSAVAAKITDASAQISSSTSEIANSATEISKGAESQLSQIVDTSSAMEEMSLSIKEVSESAKGAAKASEAISQQVRDNAKKLKDTIEGVVEASKSINQLKDKTEQIGKVIQVISDIAAQTNILSLNAAIEAARAGEYGKGFDVVAEEIRQLAQRTASSTKEIAPMIESICQTTEHIASEIDQKAKLAKEAERAFDAIKENIFSAGSLVKSISDATEQQSKTSEQVANSLQIISNASNQAAKGTQEAAIAARDLAELAQSLREITKQLKAA